MADNTAEYTALSTMFYTLGRTDENFDKVAISDKANPAVDAAILKVAKWDGIDSNDPDFSNKTREAIEERWRNEYNQQHKKDPGFQDITKGDEPTIQAALAKERDAAGREAGIVASANHYMAEIHGIDKSKQLNDMSRAEKAELIKEYQVQRNFDLQQSGQQPIAFTAAVYDKTTADSLQPVNDRYLAKNPQFKPKEPTQDAGTQTPPPPAPKPREPEVSRQEQLRAEAELHAMGKDQNNAAYLARKGEGLIEEGGKFGKNSLKDAEVAGLKGANLKETIAKIDAAFKAAGGDQSTVVAQADADMAARAKGAAPVVDAENRSPASAPIERVDINTPEGKQKSLDTLAANAEQMRNDADLRLASSSPQDQKRAAEELAVSGLIERELNPGNGKEVKDPQVIMAEVRTLMQQYKQNPEVQGGSPSYAGMGKAANQQQGPGRTT